MKSLCVVTSVLIVMGLAACETSPKKPVMAKSTAPQVVNFDDTEVPYIAVTKKNGKVTTEIVSAPAQASQLTVK